MLRYRFAQISLVAAALTGTGGCAFFPIEGPTSVEIVEGERASALPYAFVRLTPDVIDILGSWEPKGLAGVFTDKRPSSQIKFGIGDVVAVTIFEAAAGGLFVPLEAGVRPGNFVNLPEQIVDNNGNISVPFAGAIRAAGRTNVQIQDEIIERIKNRAIEPQVMVALSQQRTSLVSVIGAVNTPLRFAVPPTGAGERILDSITRAGGISGQGYETWVMLERGGKRATVPFENLVMNASNNIYIQPNDRIYVYREQQKFVAFGATLGGGVNAGSRQFNFDAWRINLAEAVAKAGGLQDFRADPGAVYLYRREPREVAKLLGVDIARFEGDLVPIIFNVSFRDPSGYFLATRLQMRNQDVIFAANAAEVDVTKFFNFVTTVGIASSSITSAISGVPTASAAVHSRTLATPIVSQGVVTIPQP
jgi:polysaccharide export outer membrane protein